MPGASNEPRFHFDALHSKGDVPTLRDIERWGVDQLTGPKGEDARQVIKEAGRETARTSPVQSASRDVAVAAATAMRIAAREIHDIAREFGYDPRSHPQTSEACTQLCLSRVSMAAADLSMSGTGARLMGDTVERLKRTILITAEAGAVRTLAQRMISEGRSIRDMLALVRADAQPETIAMITKVWGGTPMDDR